jgi:hypothetical protein
VSINKLKAIAAIRKTLFSPALRLDYYGLRERGSIWLRMAKPVTTC